MTKVLFNNLCVVGLDEVKKEQVAKGITPSNRQKEIYVKPDHSKNKAHGRNYS